MVDVICSWRNADVTKQTVRQYGADRAWAQVLKKIICALGNICHSETPNKESFFRNAKFYKIGIWTLWLFHNNLGNLQEFFGQVIHSLSPPPGKNAPYAYDNIG